MRLPIDYFVNSSYFILSKSRQNVFSAKTLINFTSLQNYSAVKFKQSIQELVLSVGLLNIIKSLSLTTALISLKLLKPALLIAILILLFVISQTRIIVNMHEQISPWSIYNNKFQISINLKSITVPHKPTKSQLAPLQTQKRKPIQKARKVQNQRNLQLDFYKEKLRYLKTQIQKHDSVHQILEVVIGDIRSKVNLQTEKAVVNDLLQERLILQLLKGQLSKSLETKPLLIIPKIKPQSERCRASKYENSLHLSQLSAEKQRRYKFKTQQKTEKLSLILNYQPFDDLDIRRRAIQLRKHKKIPSRMKKSFLMPKSSSD